jgi:uncharacterized protein
VTEPAAPVRRSERLGMLDFTRGIAVLGILLMNIVGFGLPEAYEDPTNWGGDRGADLLAWRISTLLFEGTLRGLFTLLFGAGALLFLTRDARASEATPRTAAYYRRTLLLIAFGLLNGYVLLWEGDILFYYGVTGLVLYFFRDMRTRTLSAVALAILCVPTLVNVFEHREYTLVQSRAATAQTTLAAGLTPSTLERNALEELNEIHEDHKPTTSQLLYAIREIRASYWSAFHYLKQRTFYWETAFFVRIGFAESLGMMLLGMALYRSGVLTAKVSKGTYLGMAIVGYSIGLAVNLYEMHKLESSGFSVAALKATYMTYDAGRVPMTMGHLGLIGLAWHSAAFQAAKLQLAYVGQMALTNYLSQSLICMFIFTGAGLGLFGELQRHELYYIVAIIWIAQLAWSSWWMRRFQFGPAEWLWRSLTYGCRQPMRSVSADA